MKKSVIFLFLLLAFGASANITLPSVIGSNMVLQRQSEAALWGTAGANAKVTVITSWNKKNYSTKADANGAWKLKVQTPAAGGPYEITISDGMPVKLQNILIGEVWLCSGQSNMEMPVKGFKNQPVLHAADILMEADNPQIRLFRVRRKTSRVPLTTCEAASWELSNAESAAEFSAVGYQFAQMLHEKLKVPVGIIETTWGGTVIEAWMNEQSLQPFASEIKLLGPEVPKPDRNDAMALYNAMVAPLVGYNVKGVLWYQGEANRGRAAQYRKLMSAMVRSWRDVWDCGEWPFYFVQIAPFDYGNDKGETGLLQEAQLKAMQEIPNAGMAVSMDVGEEHNIHPADKTIIAKRLLYWALAKTYAYKGVPYAGPVYRSMQVATDTVKLSFDYAANGLTTFGKPLSDFEVAGADKVFHPAKAWITGSGVAVKSEAVKAPVAVRYAFATWLVGTLFNTEGLPASSFRTDDWPIGK
jgi:sialate O-acetylesterase